MKNVESTLILMFTAVVAVAIAGCGDAAETDMEAQPETADTAQGMPRSSKGMGDMAMGEGGMPAGYVPDSLSQAMLAPLVKAYYEGGDLFFIHTEASDPAIADTLTAMMGPKVLAVPELAQAPAGLTAPIYVFANGVQGMGPLGYQPDVFPSAPGDAGYQPLRVVHLVRWNEGASPEELKSAEAVRQAREQDRLTIENTGTVINAPVLAWPAGHRGTMADMAGMPKKSDD